VVHHLFDKPEELERQWQAHVERRRRQLKGDPGWEVPELTESLENLKRGRSGYIALSAYGGISCKELHAKEADVDEQREALQKALREARDHQKTIQKLQRAGEVAFRQFAALRSMDLHHLDLEDRRRVYLALKLRGEVDKDGDVRISRLFDADIT
jgi:chromatin segregation and condensation protein Rec8/ScpA/Scc1 (kleisin family)